MGKAVIVRGRLSGPHHIGLDEPAAEMEGEVEVVVGPALGRAQPEQGDIFDFIAKLPAGQRSREDIDRQIRDEQEGWGER